MPIYHITTIHPYPDTCLTVYSITSRQRGKKMYGVCKIYSYLWLVWDQLRHICSQLDDLPGGQRFPGPDGDEIDSFLEGGDVELKGGAIHLCTGKQLTIG